MIPQHTIDQIKQAVDIVEVINDFVELKKSGSSYKGKSPFTDEKTPSFFVSPGKEIFKDFSTGKGGDAIKFVMELEGLSYVEALKYLAQKYGIEIKEEAETPEEIAQRTERDSLFIVLNFAKDFFKDLLLNHQEGQSIGGSYFKERGFTPEIIEKFDLGYSLDQWDALLKEGESKQYSVDLLEKAGLILKKEEGKVYDRFRGRVMFPIHNLTGKVIAFGARILTNDKKQPKYINSPETEVYHKSNILYGIAQGKQQIKQEENCFLVEGYTDVLALHQVGIQNVVASSGTSLTIEQIRLIKRYTNNVTVLYDGDAAGIRASLRGIDLILEEGLNVHVVLIPEGEDPDSYSRSLGGEAFREFVIKERQDFITFKTKLFLSDADDDPVKRAGVIKEIVSSIAKIPDSITRTVYFQQCARLLNISEEILLQEYNQLFKTEQKAKSKKRSSNYDQPPPPEEMMMEPYMDEMMEVDPMSMSVPVPVDEESIVKGQEQEMVRLLLNYGPEKIDEENTVAAYLLAEIEEFESFYSSVAAIIIGEYRKDPTIDASYFFEYPDEEVKNEVIGLVSDPYSMSDRWAAHRIYVTEEKHILDIAAYRAVLRLKWRNARKMLMDNMNKLQGAIQEEEIEKIQLTHKALKEFEMQIAKELGNVTIG